MLHATEDELLGEHPIDFNDSELAAFGRNLKDIFKAFSSEFNKNEATSRNFINLFMIAAVCKLNEGIKEKTQLLKLAVEYDRLGYGKVDCFFTFNFRYLGY